MMNRAELSKAFVQQKIKYLTDFGQESVVRATLAKLRRGIGKVPGSIPDLWEITLSGLPEVLLSKNGQPTQGEWAIHTALTLFAMHQQGKDSRTKCMNREGLSFGAAIRKLNPEQDKIEERIKRRFDSAATADNLVEFSHHLRGLIQLLKAEDIPLDYPALAQDLYWFQIEEARDSVRLRWGQNFYWRDKPNQNDSMNDEGGV